MSNNEQLSTTTAETPEIIRENNTAKIDEVLTKLWFKINIVDWRSWRIYNSNDWKQSITLFWWFWWVPSNYKLSTWDIIAKIFDWNNHGIRTKEMTEIINKSLWINIPVSQLEYFGRENKNDLKSYLPYIKSYEYLPYEESKLIKHDILRYWIKEQTWISVDDRVSFKWNIVNTWAWTILTIDWKWVNRNDPNFWEIKTINVNFTTWKVEVIR